LYYISQIIPLKKIDAQIHLIALWKFESNYITFEQGWMLNCNNKIESKNNMKIAIIIKEFPPKWLAGTEIATYNMASYLAKRGHEIHVITSHDDGLPNFNKEKGFYIHRIPIPKVRIIRGIIFTLNIFFKIRTIKPDIVHVQDLEMGISAYLSRKILKVPYIIWGRGSDVNLPNQFIRTTAKPILQNANAILALTEDMRIKLRKIYDTEIYVIPNGIDLEENNGVTIYPARKTDTKNILFVGSLYPVKGVEYLIIAMKIVHDKMPEARLIIVGDGEEREHLAVLSVNLGIQKYVQFVGKVPHEMVKTFMQQADVFVLPSLSEGLPNVILEAMACGLPIVASRVGGIPDTITNETNGYLIEPKDSDDLAKKIILLLQDYALLKKISENNRKIVKKYAWENVIFELEKIYELSIAKI
jgi:glycosyltransferase involved in cell wall biosynthesis